MFEAALDQSEQQGGEVSSGTRRDSSGGGSTRQNSGGSSTRRSSGGGLNGRLSSLAASSGGRDDFGDEQPLAALFCVFDGHCGRLAAEQAAQLLPRELADRIDPRQLLQVRATLLCTVHAAEAAPSCRAASRTGRAPSKPTPTRLTFNTCQSISDMPLLINELADQGRDVARHLT